MQNSTAAASSPSVTQRPPLHDEIAQCARDLWFKEGQPVDRDVGIWLDAEQRLLAASPAQRVEDPASGSVASLAGTEARATFTAPVNSAAKAAQRGKKSSK